MSSKWSKAKLALQMRLCVFVPRTVAANDEEKSPPPSDRRSEAALLSPTALTTPSSHLFRLSKSFSRSSKKTCSICLATMKCGDGHAIFTAECAHSFHFQCIASSVKHGNQVCPICRAKWKEVPFQGPALDPSPHGRARMISPLDNAFMTVMRRIPASPRLNPNRHITPPLPQASEPAIFNDDECLDHQVQIIHTGSLDTPGGTDSQSSRTVKIKTYPEVPAVPRLCSRENFTILIHLKAPTSVPEENAAKTSQASMPRNFESTRAPVDLVTVLDISGSMAGTKLALLKRAMGFVIQNLGPSDRLSIIAFSSTARRLFPLQRMSETGKQQALQAVNTLTANGGTNIAEGLRKGAKVMEDRREKNPIASIILLSDGQDTYTITSSSGTQTKPNYQLLLPMSIYGKDSPAYKIPVHAFGFGTDHDASAMHSISDSSGGTFSFIETEAVIQDAFAQCIGGLLSVVTKELQVSVECVHPSLSINSLRAGSYLYHIMGDRRAGFIDMGDLYADEERDFLVSVRVPAEAAADETSLIKVRCAYGDPLTKKKVSLEGGEVKIQRPEAVDREVASIEVDRQRNRLQAAEAMAEARTAAERGDLSGAVSILESCRKLLSTTVSAKSHDKLCVALDAELKEMQERMASRHVYEASGRAYILSGLSSHSWQRATARGDSTHCSSLFQSYQTPLMTEMVHRSQASTLGSPSTQRQVIQPMPR